MEQHEVDDDVLVLISPYVHLHLLHKNTSVDPSTVTDRLFLLLYEILSHATGLVLKKISMTLLFAVKDPSLSPAFFPVTLFLFYWNGLKQETVAMNKSLLKDVLSLYSVHSPFFSCLLYAFLLSDFVSPRYCLYTRSFIEIAQQPLELLQQQMKLDHFQLEKLMFNMVQFHLLRHSPLLSSLLQFLPTLPLSTSLLSLYIALADEVERDLSPSVLQRDELEKATVCASSVLESMLTSPSSKDELVQILSSLHFLSLLASAPFLPSSALLQVLGERSILFMTQVLLRIESYNRTHSPFRIQTSDFLVLLFYLSLFSTSQQPLIHHFLQIQKADAFFDSLQHSNQSFLRSLANAPQSILFLVQTHIHQHMDSVVSFWKSEMERMKMEERKRYAFLLDLLYLLSKQSAIFLEASLFRSILHNLFGSLEGERSNQNVDVSVSIE